MMRTFGNEVFIYMKARTDLHLKISTIIHVFFMVASDISVVQNNERFASETKIFKRRHIAKRKQADIGNIIISLTSPSKPIYAFFYYLSTTRSSDLKFFNRHYQP